MFTFPPSGLMSQLKIVEAFVLSKINYGDTSKILHIFSREYGKFSIIAKGSRSKNSLYGRVLDPLNKISISVYKKDTREMQIVSGADLINHYDNIKSDFERSAYAMAVLELIKELLPDEEINDVLYRGTDRIFGLMEEKNEHPRILFARFYLFFLKQVGYEIIPEQCASCGKDIYDQQNNSILLDQGVICAECSSGKVNAIKLEEELFKLIICLNGKKSMEISGKYAGKLIRLLELYSRQHFPDYKGSKSLTLLNY